MHRKHTEENIQDDEPIAQPGGDARARAKAKIYEEREAEGQINPERPGDSY
jgi:hypothetical protein